MTSLGYADSTNDYHGPYKGVISNNSSRDVKVTLTNLAGTMETKDIHEYTYTISKGKKIEYVYDYDVPTLHLLVNSANHFDLNPNSWRSGFRPGGNWTIKDGNEQGSRFAVEWTPNA